jgi:hypothetical protein
MKNIFEKNVLRKYILMVAVILLFFAGGYRAYTLYSTYRSYESEVQAIEKSTHTNIHNVLKVVIEEAYDLCAYKTKMDSITLHRLMIESMSMDEIYDNIVNMNLGKDFIGILDNVFNLSETEETVFITVGTKNYVFYCKSNIDSDKYDHIDSDTPYITWESYYNSMDNPEVVKMAYEDLVMHRTEYVILRIDGVYPDDKYYTIDDVIAEYHQNGMKNMDKYYILTLGVITDTGDIFGEPDDNYMQHNPNVNKIYIYKAVCLENFIKEYKPLLDSFNDTMSAKIIKVRNTTEFSNALINIFLITVSIIIIMIVIKNLDDENINISNKLDKPK